MSEAQIIPHAELQNYDNLKPGVMYTSEILSTKDALTILLKWNTDTQITIVVEQSTDKGKTWPISSKFTSPKGFNSRFYNVLGKDYRVKITNTDSVIMTYFRFFAQLAGPAMKDATNIRTLDRSIDNILVYGQRTNEDGNISTKPLNVDGNGVLNVNVLNGIKPNAAESATELTEIKNLLVEIKNLLTAPAQSTRRRRYA
jgi:hypothetical protein